VRRWPLLVLPQGRSLPVAAALLLFMAVAVPAALGQSDQPASATIRIGYLTRTVKQPPPLSLIEPIVVDAGVQGARLAIADDNTTGRFTKQSYVLDEAAVPEDGDVAAAFKALVAKGDRLLVVDLPAAALLSLADLPEAKDTLILNIQAKDDALRQEQCRANVLHVIPDRAMLADALAQYLIWKQWPRWFLLYGKGEGDKLYAEAIRRAAKKFGAKLVEDKEYDAGSTARRTDTGHAQIQKQMPVLTQGADYDVLVVADESDLFGEYLPYRTWRPRPVAGTQGLVPTAWSRVHEQWGATQLQSRFERLAKRWMAERDYTAWLAVRAVGEAATRTGKNDYASLDAFIRGPDFDLAGFKGEKLTFRAWDGQLRQPILLAAPRSLVSVSPQEGFLHEHNQLDTLGFDQPETACHMKQQG
jgi:ABC transporter substrate binding protein (PQQ-dependent alcohol dehydrogenase system)